jgi:threonine aldolase
MKDFRSDTVTLPTPEMKQAIFDAELGDDVYGEDPTVNELERLSAEIFGKEDAVLVSTGTMGNLVSILSHCQRGEQIIIGDKCHIYRAEAGGIASLGGIVPRILKNDDDGTMDLNEIESNIEPKDVHRAPTKVVALENTANVVGGKILSKEYMDSVKQICDKNELKLHIDGARIFNASVALEMPVSELTKSVDSLTFCLSKGLGAPVGSVIVGNKEFINDARKWRKMVGGGMRQAGIIAAAGIIGINNHYAQISKDHKNAKLLSEGLKRFKEITVEEVQTNLVFFSINTENPGLLAEKLKAKDVLGGNGGSRWRFATHYGIEEQDIKDTLNIFEQSIKEL